MKDPNTKTKIPLSAYSDLQPNKYDYTTLQATTNWINIAEQVEEMQIQECLATETKQNQVIKPKSARTQGETSSKLKLLPRANEEGS